MGSASSKAARKLPREKTSSGWAGSRVTPAAGAEPGPRPRPERLLAFEKRNEAIERDAKDPHFMAKLNQLGPVRVDHRTQTARTRPASDVQNRYGSRARSEAETREAARNRLLASSLTELLDARKSITSNTELETLAGRYRIDVTTLERLTRVVNTPSVDERTVVRTMDRDGDESLTMMARWTDPPFSSV